MIMKHGAKSFRILLPYITVLGKICSTIERIYPNTGIYGSIFGRISHCENNRIFQSLKTFNFLWIILGPIVLSLICSDFLNRNSTKEKKRPYKWRGSNFIWLENLFYHSDRVFLVTYCQFKIHAPWFIYKVLFIHSQISKHLFQIHQCFICISAAFGTIIFLK